MNRVHRGITRKPSKMPFTTLEDSTSLTWVKVQYNPVKTKAKANANIERIHKHSAQAEVMQKTYQATYDI